MSAEIARGWHDESRYWVDELAGETVLDPIRFSIYSARMSFQDYLTPDTARAIGRALLDAADEVGGRSVASRRCMHGHTVAEDCDDCRTDELAEEVAPA